MNRKKLILVLTLITIAGFSIIYFANSWRGNNIINKITIKGNITLNRYDILKAANIKEDTLLDIEELNLVFIQDRISKHPEVKHAFVKKEPPSEIVIEIVEKNPLAIVSLGRDLFLVDEECELFPFKNFDKLYDMPVVTGIKLNPDDKKSRQNEDLKLAIGIITNSYKKGKIVQSMISEINMADSNKIIIYSNDRNIPFYFPKYETAKMNDSLYRKNISSLFTVMKNFIDKVDALNSLKKYDYVDLRFNGQAIAKFN